MSQVIIQLLGALIILAAFVLAQARVLRVEQSLYLLLNTVGASILAVNAYIEHQWGFLLLEAVWAMVAAWGLGRLRFRRFAAKPS
jgi:hypothetical protein